MIVIDAEGAILGRLATKAAKALINGEKVVIINAEQAIISGNRNYIFRKYKQRVDRADIANPKKGPKFPRRPDLLVKRTIRGMLPKTSRGKDAIKSLRVFMGVDSKYAEKAEKIEGSIMHGEYMTIKELSKMLGWKG